MRLTTARYYTPSGTSIQAKGITPDIVVEEATIQTGEEPRIEVREADLERHLSNGDAEQPAKKPKAPEDKPKADKDGKKDGKDKPEPGEIVSKSDYQLNQALNLLKGLHLLQSR